MGFLVRLLMIVAGGVGVLAVILVVLRAAGDGAPGPAGRLETAGTVETGPPTRTGAAALLDRQRTGGDATETGGAAETGGATETGGAAETAVTDGGTAETQTQATQEGGETGQTGGGVRETLEEFAAAVTAADRFGALQALRAAYPEQYDALMAELYEAASDGAEPRALQAMRSAFFARFFSEKIRYIPFASDAALRRYFSYNHRLYVLARDMLGAEACSEVIQRRTGAMRQRLSAAAETDVSELIQQIGGQATMLIEVARDGETAGARELARPQGGDWRNLYRRMEMDGASRRHLAMMQTGSVSSVEDICAVTIHYLAALTALEGEIGARMRPFEARKLVSAGG